jgi:amino acid adenylation domain-containing protein
MRSEGLGRSVDPSLKERRTFSPSNSETDAAFGEMCVPQLVTEFAHSSPDAAAIVANNAKLTYSGLDALANRVANRLRALGVGPEILVGLCFRRSAGFVVGALGILKAGGAYVPLDPDYPDERLSFLLADSGARVIVAEEHLAERFRGRCENLVELDILGREIGAVSAVTPSAAESKVLAEDLAYVIYTSGSTGKPKGVEITHGSLRNLISWHQRAFGVTASDRASQVAGVAFDAAVWEIWPYLAAGASVHFPNETVRKDPGMLCNWMVEQEITIGFVPTPLAERMLTLCWPANTSLRTLLTGADTFHRHPSAELPFSVVNNYGPTECTVVATSGIVPPTLCPEKLPTIGRPIANVQVYILNEYLRPVESDAPGEIYIAGTGLARGYRNNPELTAERFLPNCLASEPGRRMYRTGDLARLLPDGQLEFLGRVDDQIKVKGFRIEPQEIVAALNRHRAVEASAVVARTGQGGEKALVAYVVAVPGATLMRAALREHLLTSLPEYMVPSSFVALQVLPVSAHGKIDRAALPVPDESNTLRDESFIAPRTAVEKTVAEILAPLLGLDTLGMKDNFFALGGHSLLGAQLIVRVRDVFGVAMRLRNLFEAPTVEGLSAWIEQQLIKRLASMSEEEAERLLDKFAETSGDGFHA